jgi:hypothetical protein
MIQVMAALRKLVGFIGAGFEFVQDMADELFQGILPASFVVKYAVNGFQAAMEARYSQPTSHDDKGRARNHVPTSANARPISRVARARNSLAGAGRIAQSVVNSPVGRMTGILTLASLSYEMADEFITAQANARLAEMWPDNFTLFGFAQVVNKFDDLESFLLEDSSCYMLRQYELLNRTYIMFPCLDLQMKRYSQTDEGTTSIDATQCWADANPSIGQNSLFACSASSTCCEGQGQCDKLIACGACGTPSMPLTNKYGCDSALRKCVCGVPKQEVDRCSANLHCDASAQCELVSSMSSISYGTIPCKLCPSDSQVLCLLDAGKGMPGGCACILERVVQLAACSATPGSETTVDGSRLCGYLPGQSPTSTQWAFDMENLMVVPCAEAAVGVCSTVYNMAGVRSSQGGATTSMRMVVAASLRTQQASRRRLLQQEDEPETHRDEPETHRDGYEDDARRIPHKQLDELLTAPGWDSAASPCNALALAYQEGKIQFGVLETVELRRCAFWRLVGRRVLRAHNLSTRVGETFLVSWEDLIKVTLAAPDATLALLRNPTVFASALMYHPWMRPVRSLGVEIANRLEHLRWVREIDFDVHEALFGDALPDEPEKKQRNRAANASARGRRLLSSSVVSSAEQVAQFSAQIIRSAPSVERAAVPSRVAGAWSTASFAWPPVYDYSGKSCPLALAALDMGRQAAMINALYFRNFDQTLHPPRPIDRSLRGNLPNISAWIPASLPPGEAAAVAARSWASWVFHRALDLGGIRPSHLVAFFTTDQKWSLQWILETSIKCDLAAVVTCSMHDKDLIMSTVVFLLFYTGVRVVTGALGLGSALSTLFLLSYPGFILWYAFGTPPSCFPMVPTCLLSDLIATLELLVPARLVFPDDLTNCGDGCLRSCADLNFTGWEDPLAFALCDTDPGTCQFLLERLPVETGFPALDAVAWTRLRRAIERSEHVVRHAPLAGHRLCTWVSFVTATPVLAALGGAAVLAGAACMALLDLVPSVVAFTGQLYVFYAAAQ